MKILVTGATGFIGRNLIPYLCSKGHQVTIMVRDPEEVPERWSVQIIQQNHIGATRAAQFEGQDVVVHLAGVAHDHAADKSEYETVNVGGTISVVNACVSAGVKRLIYLSSVKVNGPYEGEPFSPRSAKRPDDEYGRSKLKAEDMVKAQTTLETVIVRVPLVYGPNVKGNFASLVKLVKLGLPLPFGSITARRSYLSTDNLNDLLVHCLTSSEVAGKVVYGSDPDSLTLPQLLNLIAAGMERPLMLMPIPTSVLRPICSVFLGASRIEKLFGALEVDVSYSKKRRGWSPPYTTRDCLDRMFGHSA